MKANFITFVRGLKNGTPPRFQSYLKSLTLLLTLLLSVNVWGDSFVINTTNFTAPNSGSGYAAYNGTRTISDIDITSNKVMVQSDKLQFQKASDCYLFNADAIPGNITKITLSTPSNFTIYVGTSSHPTSGSVTSGSSISGSNKYFTVIGSSSATATTATITVEYAIATAASVTSLYLWEAGVKSSNLKGDYKVGAKYTLPTTCSQTCGDKTFVGWSTTEEIVVDNLYKPGDEVELKAENIFYAVFADATIGEDENHDYSQTLSQLLNNNASIASINIGKPDFTIKKVIVTFSYNNTKQNAVTIEAKVGSTSWGSETIGAGSKIVDGTVEFTGTEAQEAVTISFTNNTGSGTGHGTFSVSKVTLVESGTTYSNYTTTCSTPEPDYKVTVSSNNENWGIAEINGSTISTFAEDGYRISKTNPYIINPVGAATVTPQGTDEFLVSEVTEDCEITINFEQIPTYSVNFYINGIATPKSIQEGEKVIDYAPTTPAAFDQDFQTFVGWTISAINGIAEDKPTLITDETVTAPANYYAVFAGETLGNTYTWYKEKTLPNGNYLIAGYSNDNDYLMKNTLVSSYYIGADNQGDSYSSYEDPDETNIWKLTTTTDGTTIYNEKIEKYVELYQDGSYYDLGFSSDPCYFAITAGDEVFTIKSKKYSSYYLYFDASHSNFVAKNSSSDLYLFKQDVETTGYITNKTNRVTLHYDANAGTEVIAGVPEDARINKDEAFTLPTDKLTRTGYTHLGWSESSTATEPQTTITPTADVTVYAVWKINSYKLTWELNGGTVTEEGTPDGSVEFGTTLTAPILEKTGYTYSWNPAVPEKMPASDATYSAVWEAKKTTVNFNFNLGKDAGGTAIVPDNAATQSVTATYDAAMPSIKVLPQKEGKIFIGYSDKDVEKYYYNADGESQCVWDKDAKNATIYAQWQDKEAVTVSFADNMHENTIPTINTYSGETFTFPAALADQTPVAGTCQGEHSHFMGWVKTSDEVTDANIHAAGSTSGTLTGSESYLAVWAKVDGDAAAFDGTKGGDFYIAVYDSHSGSEVTYYATGAVSNKKLASTTDKSEATVYTFTKGTGDNAGKFSIKTGSDYIKYSSSTDLANSYDAYWWTITAKPEGMPGSWNIQSETSGRSLDYQSYSSKGSGANYEETESHLFGGYSTSNIATNKDQYLYVEIEQVVSYIDYLTECCQTYDITLVDNGEKTEGTFMAGPTPACEGTEITILQEANTGYTFKEYTFTKTDGGDEINPDDLTFIEDVFLMPNYDITIDATFTANKHNVIFQKNDGQTTAKTQEFTYGVEQELALNTFEWAGHKFNGWSTTSTGGVEYEDGAKYTLNVDNDVQLYAVWTADDAVSVSVTANEHLTAQAPTSVSAAAKNLAFSIAVAEGYKVEGVTVTIGGEPVTEGITFNQTMFSLITNENFAGAIVITFDVKEILYTVTIDAGTGQCSTEKIVQSSYNADITLPAASTVTAPADWEFAGWCANQITEQTDDIPTLFAAGSDYKPVGNTTIYAVYKQSKGDGGDETIEFTPSSHEGWNVQGTDNTSYYLLGKQSITSPVIADLSTITSISAKVGKYSNKGAFTIKAGTYSIATEGIPNSTSGNNYSYKSTNISWPTMTGSGSVVLSNTDGTSGSSGSRVFSITINCTTPSTYHYHSTPNVVVKVEVKTIATKNTRYKEGDMFNAEGIVLTATYKDGTTTDVAEDFTWDLTEALTPANTAVVFTYKNVSTEPTTISVGTLDHIALIQQPTKKDYTEGENFDSKGISVRAYYTNEAYQSVTSEVTYDPSTNLQVGTTQITVYYLKGTPKEKTCTIEGITVKGKVATPVITPASGKVSEETTVTISCTTPEATIYYTTDNTTPTTSSNEYSSSFKVDPGTTVRAYAVREGWTDSEVAKAVYAEQPVFDQGDWILVTDPAELTAGSYVIIANADYKFAMKSYVSGDYCATETATISEDGSMLTYNVNFGVFELREYKVENEVKGISFFDYAKEQYLYYSGSSNTLKAQDDQDNTAAWTFSQSENDLLITNYVSTKRQIRYNSSANPTRFACYEGTQNSVQLYKYYKPVPKIVYNGNMDNVTNVPVPTRSTNGTAIVTTQVPTRGGWEFVKWTDDEDGEGNVYSAEQEINNMTVDINLYAQWTKKPLEGTPMAIVVKYGDNYYAMKSDLSAVEVEGVYNENVVVVSEVVDQTSITWYRKEVDGGVTFQNSEEEYLIGGSNTTLSVGNEATTWTWNAEGYYEYSSRSFFTQGTTEFKNYSTGNINKSGYSSAAIFCTSFRVGEVFTRDMSNGYMGTHCYPFDIAAGNYRGAQFYEIAYRIGDTRIYFDQVDHVEAGVPYLVVPEEENGSILEAIVTPKVVDASNKNGFYGSYEQEDLEANSGLYIVYNNEFRLAGNYVAVGANRAYIKLAEVETNDPQQGAANAPRRISLRNSNAQSPTGIDNVVAEFGDSKEAKKVIVNGNFYIINQGKVYGAQGQLVK